MEERYKEQRVEERDELYVTWVVETRMNEFASRGITADWDCLKIQACREVLTAIEQDKWPGLLLAADADLEADE
jgi:hypothetical protein